MKPSIYFQPDGKFQFGGLVIASVFRRGALLAMRSLSTMKNGSTWIHVSVSRRDRDPTWAEMALAKDDLIGCDSAAIMVLPPRSEHVNIQNHCFHWWEHKTGELCIPNLHGLTNEEPC